MFNEADLRDLSHDHVFLGSLHDENARRTLWVVGLTATTMVGEIVAGHVIGSMALLADGFHMATHAGALSVAAAAYAYTKRHASSTRFSFGTGKVGDLAGFVSAPVLGLISLGIGWESILRPFQPITVAFGTATWIACVGLGVNIASALLLSGGHSHAHHLHHDHHRDTGPDNNLRSAYVLVIADALTSVLAIAAAEWTLSRMGVDGPSYGHRRCDRHCPLVVVSHADTSAVLLDTAGDHVAEEVRELVEAPGDAKIIDLHVWRVGPEAHAAIVEVTSRASVDALRDRPKPVHEIALLTVAVRRSANLRFGPNAATSST